MNVYNALFLCTGNSARSILEAFRVLSNRIGIFVDLPLASLDRQTLRKRLGEIGQGEDIVGT